MIANNRITLLNNIEVDFNLPKYKDRENPTSVNTWGVISSNVNRLTEDSHLEYLKYLYANAPTVYLKFKIWLYRKMYGHNFDAKLHKISKFNHIKSFFDSIKNNVRELEKSTIEEVLNKYDTVLQNAKDNNQVALVEKIEAFAETLKYELTLSVAKYGKKYLTEADIVAFHSKASVHDKYRTGLCLTYIKNFVKVIPESVSKKKKAADTLNVFDNYVILHYDPLGSASADTNAEKEKKKDPILFGVIKNSRNLYFIDDWIDDYCDLTLDTIIKTIGKEASEITEDSILIELDNI